MSSATTASFEPPRLASRRLRELELPGSAPHRLPPPPVRECGRSGSGVWAPAPGGAATGPSQPTTENGSRPLGGQPAGRVGPLPPPGEAPPKRGDGVAVTGHGEHRAEPRHLPPAVAGPRCGGAGARRGRSARRCRSALTDAP